MNAACRYFRSGGLPAAVLDLTFYGWSFAVRRAKEAPAVTGRGGSCDATRVRKSVLFGKEVVSEFPSMSRKFSTFAFCALMSAAASAQFCTANATVTACGTDEYISNVTVDAFTNNSACVAGGYQDFTGLSPIQMSVSVGASVSVSISSFWSTDKVTVWIDLNNDLAFGAGEAFDLPDPSNASGGTVVVNGTVTIPACTPPGLGRRMRVALNYNLADPQPACGTHNFGGWQDYTVDILGPVVGDTCACPLTANLGATAGNATGATYDASACNGGDANLWYAFTPATSDFYSFDASGATFYGVFGGVCGSLTPVLCNSLNGIQFTSLTAGVTYYVEVGDWLASNAFTLNINPFVPAVNDECSGALPIFAGVTPGLSSANATTSAASACASISSDVWFAFTAQCNGVHTFQTCGYTGDDTVIALYGSCGGAQLACDDQGCGSQSTISVGLTAGATYYLRVGGWAGGGFNSSIEIIPPSAGLSFPTTPGLLSLSVADGTPFGGYFAAVTANQGAFPNGTFFGIDIALTDLFLQIAAGAPFIGLLDGNGCALHGPYAVPPGLTLYGVALDNVFAPGFTATAPTTVTTI
jgi:hypothetical protein